MTLFNKLINYVDFVKRSFRENYELVDLFHVTNIVFLNSS